MKIVKEPMYINEDCGRLIKETTVASRYLDPAYLDPITYVEPMSESRIFLLYIYCILTSHVSNFF